MSDGPYLFLHVPKTAGTSLRLAVERACPGQVAYDYGLKARETAEAVRAHVYRRPDLPTLAAWLKAEGIAMLGGHVHYRKYASIVAPNRVITFLREPLARIVSEHQHACRHNGFESPLMEFAQIKRNKNLQTKMLAGVDLESAAFVGITERYGEGLALLGHRAGWQLDELVRNVNPERDGVLAGSYPLSSAEEATLRQDNAEDLELYERATEQFDLQLAAINAR